MNTEEYFTLIFLVSVVINILLIIVIIMSQSESQCIRHGFDYETVPYDKNSNFVPLKDNKIMCCDVDWTKDYQDEHCEIIQP